MTHIRVIIRPDSGLSPLRQTLKHSCDVIMATNASPITNLTIVYSAVYTGADQRKYQSSASMAFVRGIHRGPVNSPHKWPVTRKMFPFDDVIMNKCKMYGIIDTSLTTLYQQLRLRVQQWFLIFWMVSIGLENSNKIIDSKKKFKANVCNVIINTVPADG